MSSLHVSSSRFLIAPLPLPRKVRTCSAARGPRGTVCKIVSSGSLLIRAESLSLAPRVTHAPRRGAVLSTVNLPTCSDLTGVRTCSYLLQSPRPCNINEYYQSETDNDSGLLSDSSATTWPRGHRAQCKMSRCRSGNATCNDGGYRDCFSSNASLGGRSWFHGACASGLGVCSTD